MLSISHTPHVFEFKLNSPKTLNSLDLDMFQIMLRKLEFWNQKSDSTPRIIIITGNGDKAFCAGGDVVTLYNSRIGKADPSIRVEYY